MVIEVKLGVWLFNASRSISCLPLKVFTFHYSLKTKQCSTFTVILYIICLELLASYITVVYLPYCLLYIYIFLINYLGPKFLCRNDTSLSAFNLSMEPYNDYYHVYSSSAEHECIPILAQQLLWRRWIGCVHSGVWRDWMRPVNEQNAVSVTKPGRGLGLLSLLKYYWILLLFQRIVCRKEE